MSTDIAPSATAERAIPPSAVTPSAIVPGAVTSGAVTSGAVTPDTVTPDTVTPDTVTPDTVTPDTIAPGAVTMGATASCPMTGRSIASDPTTERAMTGRPVASVPIAERAITATERALHAILKSLIPFFLGADQDQAAAREAAFATLQDYNPQTLTDYLAAARAITFSLGAIGATARGLDPDLPEKRQHQYLTKATGFARLAHRAETALQQARKHRPAAAAMRPIPAASMHPAALPEADRAPPPAVLGADLAPPAAAPAAPIPAEPPVEPPTAPAALHAPALHAPALHAPALHAAATTPAARPAAPAPDLARLLGMEEEDPEIQAMITQMLACLLATGQDASAPADATAEGAAEIRQDQPPAPSTSAG